MNNHLVVPKTKSKKRFQQGSWQHVMCDLICQANPYCVVQKAHQATKRRLKMNHVFSAEGYCKLSTFRNREKRLYGADKICRPVQINSDHAMVFIVSALHVFNAESFETFLSRAWSIANGIATSRELEKTIIHTCAFHFMRNC